MIEAADEREEALALAIALREALEGEGTAVLVTPDRALGRRVREELARWAIDIDESGGEPLGTTPAGAFARLVLDCALGDLAPVEVLALLAHPLARFGRAARRGGAARPHARDRDPARRAAAARPARSGGPRWRGRASASARPPSRPTR